MRLRRYLITGAGRVFPNKKVGIFKTVQFKIWGGERYDTHSGLFKAKQYVAYRTITTDGIYYLLLTGGNRASSIHRDEHYP